jgi:flagellar basal-body rod modification protein FlgD
MLDMDIINAAVANQNLSSEVAAQRRAANDAHAKKSELNQEDFLTLMITQLKHQDPFKPLDPAQYVGQLAQFSSVSGLADMNKQISALTASLRGNQVLDGAALIGRTVMATGNEIYLPPQVEGQDRGPQGLVDVPAGASSLQLVVKDSSGALVRTQALDNTRGLQPFAWDGTKDGGAQADEGHYQIEVIASVGGKNVSLETSVATMVNSVALDPASGSLRLETHPLGDLAMSDIQRVL